jgi:hypothetical protein
VHLDLQVLYAPLPLVDLGLGQLLAQVVQLALELADLSFQLCVRSSVAMDRACA